MEKIQEFIEKIEKENQELQIKKDSNNVEIITLETEVNRLQSLANIEVEKITIKREENQEIDKKIEKNKIVLEIIKK